MFKVDFTNPIHVHFIGIGGISMSGLAEILIDRGFTITGSDNVPSDITERLKGKGAKISFPQSAENITEDIDLVVYTAAIHPDNPEYAACEKAGLPMLSRAKFLGQLLSCYERSVAVAGTHGKTTTTGMVGEILLLDGDSPTISIGGVLPSIGSNICVGGSDVFLTEACEYTNSYHAFYPKYNCILNVEEDHMDFFKDLADVRASFKRFAENTAADGALIINREIDDLEELVADVKSKVVTFGEGGDYHAGNVHVEGSETVFSVIERGEDIGEVRLSVPGQHNVKNALAAIALTRAMGVDFAVIQSALARFHGTERRFEYRGELNGASLYDDYAHHPTEIAASLAAARSLPHDRLVVIFQPHTYTRTKAFLHEFADVLSEADIVGLVPVYPAREEDIYGVHSDDVARLIDEKIEQKMPSCKAVECHNFGSFDEAEKFLKKISSTGDLLITMGAGDVVKIANSLMGG